jgi:phage shock protein A
MIKRLFNVFRGFVGLFVSGMERRNPEALLEIERENLRKQIAQYNQGLAEHAGLCERLMSQVKRLETDENELRAKTSANLRAGNKEAAGQFALRLQTVSAQLKENRVQLESAEKTYQELVRAREVSVRAAQDKIEALKFSLSDLKIKKATAELNEMAAGMVQQIGGAGDTLGRLSEMVEEDRQRASGRARVARDSLQTGDFALKEAEQKALADQALADFAAKEGIALDPAPAAAATEHAPAAAAPLKTMGPESQ